MPEGQVLEFSAVTKRFGAVTAVDGFTARVEPGRVTGFLGPNGAGKTTTLRILLGLVRATEGSATIGGVPYAKLRNPLQSVGAVLEASSFHPGRTAANHLKVYAQAAGLPQARIDEALGLVGLGDVAGRKVGGYSLGMRQRLGLAYALVGDPGVLVLDEPANGLDPEGIRWMRGLLRELARQGRTVLVSSHLLAEVQQTVDALLIIAGGRLVFEGGLDELSDPSESATVVDSRDRAALTAALRDAHVEVEVLRSGLTVRGLDPADVGQLAADAGIALTSLHRRGPALEEVFLDLVNGTRVHSSAGGWSHTPADGPRAAAAVAGVPVTSPAPATDHPADIAETHAGDDLPLVAETHAADDLSPVVEAEAAGRGPAAVTEDGGTAADADAAAPAGFAVASTGVIDIIPATASGDAVRAGEPAREEVRDEAVEQPDAAADRGVTEEIFTVDDDEAAADAGPDETLRAEPATATEEWDSVAPADEREAEPAEPAEAEPDEHEAELGDTASAEWASVAPVEADGEDSARETGTEAEEPAPESSDRPWERYVKTDADREADRFFAAFDEHTASAASAEAAQDGPFVTELETPEPDELGAPPPDWHAQPEPLTAEEAVEADSEPEEPADRPAQDEDERRDEWHHEQSEGDEPR
ncbi:ABC transporter ATP-binding protein [Microbacterium sp. BK668]|uniref:ABC transporter ATP-binding protein n=1 Tax=Microbacterium sp. BK668 TaxID=2512118 RepID=UPI00105B36B7|nr:ABC transporter ATP-binding protein [Microbacterium sp. BK668]TDN91348.1 ABC-type multidrug transport system ATPase subunit [Microbacterium sp. BK668]